MWWDPNQHMHMIPIDRPGIDLHLVSLRNFAQQFAGPLPHVAAHHRISVLRDPHDVILAVPDRVTSRLRILHNRSGASRSPKGEGFTDPGEATLNRRQSSIAAIANCRQASAEFSL